MKVIILLFVGFKYLIFVLMVVVDVFGLGVVDENVFGIIFSRFLIVFLFLVKETMRLFFSGAYEFFMLGMMSIDGFLVLFLR